MVIMPLRAAINYNDAADSIRMNVFATVHPRPVPWPVIDDNNPLTPGNTVVTPSPGPECHAQGNAIAETNSRSDKESRPRALIDDNWIIVRNYDVIGSRRHNRDIWAG